MVSSPESDEAGQASSSDKRNDSVAAGSSTAPAAQASDAIAVDEHRATESIEAAEAAIAVDANGNDEAETVEASLESLGIKDEQKGAETASDEGEISSSKARTSTGHSRTDSVPPQRYEVSSPKAKARVPVPQMMPARRQRDRYSLDGDIGELSTETEEAGLSFVDISLGAEPRSPYSADVSLAAPRSPLEIRKDFIASSSSLHSERDLTQMERSESGMTDASDRRRASNVERTPRPSDTPATPAEGTPRHERWQPSSTDSDSPTTSRSVEGRYRGRLSQPGSGTVSPMPQSPRLRPSASTRSMTAMELTPAVSMTVVGEDGVIRAVPGSAISLESPSQERPTIPPRIDSAQFKVKGENEPYNGNVGERGRTSDDRAAEQNMNEKKDSTEANQEEGPTSPTLKDAADGEADKAKDKKRRESAGVPSAFEQHMSRTRMTNLPPKPKQEDVRHLNDYEAMMKQSRELEKRRQQEEEAKKIKRDQELQDSLKTWEADILPSWTRARREGKLRRLWWKGIPPMLRGRLWALACGNNQMLARNLFAKASEAARDARKAGTFPASITEAIEADIENTLPTLRLFQNEIGALHDDLFDLLCAFTEFRLDQMRTGAQSQGSAEPKGAYIPGTASLAAMMLINLSPSDSLIALINLIAEKPWLRALYTVQPTASANGTNGRSVKQQHPAAGFERAFDTLLADQWPKVYANMQAQGIRPSAYASQWTSTLFVPYLPLETVARLWDCILLDEGDALIYRIGIAIFSLLSSRLYAPDKDELVSILRGNNRASIAVWNRFRFGREAPQSPTNQRRSGILDSAVVVEEDGDAATPASPSSPQIGTNGATVSSPRPPMSPSSPSAASRPSHGRRSSSNVSGFMPLAPGGIEAPDELVPRDDIYGGQYGITESLLFRTLEEQESWWKDSTLERLLDRELVS